MKKNFIYIVRTRSAVFEAVYRGKIRSVFLWLDLPFANCESCPRFTTEEDVLWSEEVCPSSPTLTADVYKHFRDKLLE